MGTRMVKFIQEIPAVEREYLEKGVVGPHLIKNSIVNFIKEEGDKVLCTDGTGHHYYVPREKVEIIEV